MQKKKKKSLNDKIEDIVSNNTIWVFLGFILVVIILPRFLLEKSFLGYVPNDPKIEPSSIINNLTAPIIGLFSAFLVYIAFKEQVKANKMLMDFNEKQMQISEFQNLKVILDYIHEIGDNIKVREGLGFIIGFNSSLKKITGLSDSIKKLQSYDVETNIDIDQFINLEYKLNLFKEKIESSKLNELDKQFLLYDIHNRYHINYFSHFSYEEYIERINNDPILSSNKEIYLRRASYFKRLVECLDQFHKY